MIMSVAETKDLQRFIKGFPSEVQRLLYDLRAFIWERYPDANELIYDNYNALAIGWSPTDRVGHIFCNIALGRSTTRIHFGFYWGSKLDDPKGILLGEGNQYRYVIVENEKSYNNTYIRKLMKKAYAYSRSLVKDQKQIIEGQTITKSISTKKRPVGRKSVVKRQSTRVRGKRPG